MKGALGSRTAKVLVIVALAIAVAAILRALWISSPTLDAWAFLDWGRDILHGRGLGLENRTFHPLPLTFSALISLTGSPAPALIVIASLTCLVLLAFAAARIVLALDCGLPAAALVAVAVVVDPLLNGLGYVAYVNLPFAMLVVAALSFELAERPARNWTWGLLIAAGLVRPEGWLFLVAYALWRGWRAPVEDRRRYVALALAPIVLWLGLELILFGNPLYSFSSTQPPVGQDDTATPGHWFEVVGDALPWPFLVAFAVGLVGIFEDWIDRRRGAIVLGATLVALLTTIGLAASGFNVPARHFSVLVSLALVVAAAGTAVPALLVPRGSLRPLLASAAVFLVALFAWPAIDDNFHRADRSISAKLDTDRALIAVAKQTRAQLPLAGCAQHSIALLGTIRTAELAWAYDVPFKCADDLTGSPTQVIVRPTPATYERLAKVGLSDRPSRGVIPPGFQLVGGNDDWLVYRRQ